MELAQPGRSPGSVLGMRGRGGDVAGGVAHVVIAAGYGGPEVLSVAAPGADPGTEIRERARLHLARLAGEGNLRVIVSQTFPLAEAAAAHRAIGDGHTVGKIALIP
jgi:NADPH:quinone reductase-like Zn-dependent oxidoreductase